MKNSDKLEKNLNNKIDEIETLFNQLEIDLSQKLDTTDESKELLEILENYKLKFQNLSEHIINEEE
tara:strand:+ start:5661 stop:5858 length:198 start_codon:yes stop_codon:yes gene_type:complete